MVTHGRRLEVLTEQQARSLYIALSQYGTRELAELDIPVEDPTLIQEIVHTHLGEMGYDLEQLAEVLHLSERETRSYYVSAGKEPHLRLIKGNM